MKTSRLLATLLLLICTTTVFAQNSKDKSFKTITVALNTDSTFNKMVDYLQDKDIMILALDKSAGFIQAKTYIKNEKIFSAKLGERRTMNFILRPAGNKTNINLNIFKENYSVADSRYYDDKGASNEEIDYKELLIKLQKALDQ